MSNKKLIKSDQRSTKDILFMMSEFLDNIICSVENKHFIFHDNISCLSSATTFSNNIC